MKKNKSLLIIGTGYYTLGDEKNLGSILSSTIQWLKEEKINFKNFKLNFLIKDKKKLRKKHNLIKKHISYFKQKLDYSFILPKQINNNYDACIIATPEEYHYFYSNIILKKKIPIYCVKPFGQKLLECKKIIKLSKKNKTPVYVEFHKRFDKANLSIGNTISKNLNLNYQIVINYSQPSNIPNINFAKWAHKTNPFQFLAPHYLDLINLWFKPKKYILKAEAIRKKNREKRIYEAVTVLLKFKKNKKTILVTINCNWMEPLNFFQKSRQNIEVITNKFHIYSDQAFRGMSIYDNKGYKEPNNYFTFFNKNNFSGYAYKSFKAFFDKIYLNSNNNNLARLDDYIFTSDVIERVNKEI